MRKLLRLALTSLFALHATTLSAEVLIRWDQDSIPPPSALGVTTVVVPAGNAALIRTALGRGYRVLIEVEAPVPSGFTPPAEGLAGVLVNGDISPQQVAEIQQRLKSPGARIQAIVRGGKWPHIRTNWVTKNGEVLQVSSRSAQPWLDSNAALLRIAGATAPGIRPLLTYAWQPATLADADEGPALEDYLVAIAEAGSFGGDLLLPLHPRFQRNLAVGQPAARIDWEEIRRYCAFYAWDLPQPYTPVANIGVIASDAAPWFEVMNLLLRHNLPFALVQTGNWASRELSSFDLLIVLDRPAAAQLEVLSEFARKGGAVVIDRRASGTAAGERLLQGSQPAMMSADRVTYTVGSGRVVEVLKGIPDPNVFALEVRQLLGRERRVIDIWNGITVLTAAYQHPDGKSLLVTALNYAHQPVPVQLRVRGIYSTVYYESPEDRAALLPYEHRDGGTELTLPPLKAGARIFLSDRKE